MLNPSTADAALDDPTLRRCVTFAKAAGFSALQVVNLFAYRASDPAQLRTAPDPVGPDNDDYLRRALTTPGVKVAAWGVHSRPDRVGLVKSIAGGALHCLGVTRDGHPRHPLYVAGGTPFTPWPPSPELHR